MEIRRIRQTEAEAVTDLWDEAGRSVPDGGPLKERGRRNIAAMLVLAASSHRVACFVDDALRGFVLAELAEDGLLPCQYGRIEELYARGHAELERALVRPPSTGCGSTTSSSSAPRSRSTSRAQSCCTSSGSNPRPRGSGSTVTRDGWVDRGGRERRLVRASCETIRGTRATSRSRPG
jgi:hypothetical protein